MTSRSRFVLSLLSTAFVLYLASGPLMRRALGDTGYTQLSIFHEVVSMIRDSYVDPVNMDRTLDAAESGLLEALDGDSGYLDVEDFKTLQAGKRAPADTGIVLGRRFGFLTVVATRPDSPARKAGIKAGDFIKFIDGKHTHGLTVVKGERLLEGEPGTSVKVAIFKSGTDAVETAVVRERPAATLPVSRLLDGGIGYIAVSDVSDGVASTLKSTIAGLQAQGARALVLDLRSSATGALKNAVPLSELFIKGGVVAKLATRNAPEQTLVASDTHVRVLDGSTEVARHARTWDMRQVVEDPAHLEGLKDIKRKAHGATGRERLLTTVPTAERLYAELAARQEPLGRETTALLELLDRYGHQALTAAIDEALARGTPRAASVAHLLAQSERGRRQTPELPLRLPNRPGVSDLTVRNHNLEDYDDI
jgi:hypothetical protein